MAPIGNAVFATLLMNDGYLPGAMVLGHSLRDRGAKGKLVALVLLDRLAANTITELKTVYDDIVPVKQIMNKTPANLYLMDRPDLISTFTKIELWRQVQYSRIVYLDADMVSLRAPNELLTMDTHFAAVPDIGWPDCFNSGMMVLNPNMAEYYSLLALAERGISFDGADQGLLNMHFTDWERLSFKFNCTPSGNYQYLPAYRHFQSGISMLHFIGKDKPWTLGRTSRRAQGVYAELLARWWAVYDRHYKGQQTVYYPGKYQEAPKKVQDYVSGEETLYLPAYQKPKDRSLSQSGVPASTISASSTSKGSTSAPQASSYDETIPPSEQSAPAIEDSMGDQPGVEEQIQKQEYTPTPTVQQRRFSAPHAEWEPARAPPPPNAKPEAVNFPSTVYEMSESRELFQPPARYPEAPKDMWYQVPPKPAPTSTPKQIFPWESHAPKPTRVFAEPVSIPSPPPEPLFPPDEPDVPDTTTSPSAPTESDTSSESTEATREPYVDPWTTFNQRTNAWDEMPEITKYMQSITPAKKGSIQVLHHTPSTSAAPGSSTTPPTQGGRRDSARVTDFPTEHERPSLPVTPAPRRRTLWGDEGEDQNDLPGAEGVPRQTEWVRRFSSYPTPAFTAALTPLIHQSDDLVYFECQHCGKQNPITKLDELQRRQSEALLNKELGAVRDPPKREMPESESKEAVVKATEKALSPPARVPLKPILKEPKFGLPAAAPVSEVEPEPAPEVVSRAEPAPSKTELTSTPAPAPAEPLVVAPVATAVEPAVEAKPIFTTAPFLAARPVPDFRSIPVSVSKPEPAPSPAPVVASSSMAKSVTEQESAPAAKAVPTSAPFLASAPVSKTVSTSAPFLAMAPLPSHKPAAASIPTPMAEPVIKSEPSTEPVSKKELVPISAPVSIPALAPAVIAAPPAVPAIAREIIPDPKLIDREDTSTTSPNLDTALPVVALPLAPPVIAAPPAKPESTPVAEPITEKAPSIQATSNTTPEPITEPTPVLADTEDTAMPGAFPESVAVEPRASFLDPAPVNEAAATSISHDPTSAHQETVESLPASESLVDSTPVASTAPHLDPAPAVIAAPPATTTTTREIPLAQKPLAAHQDSDIKTESVSAIPIVAPAPAPPVIAAHPATDNTPSAAIVASTADDTQTSRTVLDSKPAIIATPAAAVVAAAIGHERSSAPESATTREVSTSETTSDTTSQYPSVTPAPAPGVTTSHPIAVDPVSIDESALPITATAPASTTVVSERSSTIQPITAEETLSSTRAVLDPAPAVIAAPPAVPAIVRAPVMDTTTAVSSERRIPSEGISTTSVPNIAPLPAPPVMAAPPAAVERDVITAPIPVQQHSSTHQESNATSRDELIQTQELTSAPTVTVPTVGSVESLTPAPPVIAAPPAISATSREPALAAHSTAGFTTTNETSNISTLAPISAPSIIAAHPPLEEEDDEGFSVDSAILLEPTRVPFSTSTTASRRVTPMIYDAVTMPFESDRMITHEMTTSEEIRDTASGSSFTRPILASEAIEAATRAYGVSSQTSNTYRSTNTYQSSTTAQTFTSNLTRTVTTQSGSGLLDEFYEENTSPVQPTQSLFQRTTIHDQSPVSPTGNRASMMSSIGGSVTSPNPVSPQTASPTGSARQSRSRGDREHRHSGSGFLNRVQSLLHRSHSREKSKSKSPSTGSRDASR